MDSLDSLKSEFFRSLARAALSGLVDDQVDALERSAAEKS